MAFIGLIPYDGSMIEEIALVEENISPSCLISDENGGWGLQKDLAIMDWMVSCTST